MTYNILSITPSGHLQISQSTGSGEDFNHIDDREVVKAFEESVPAGLFALSKSNKKQAWPVSLHYWRKFANHYVHCLCQQIDRQTLDAVAPPARSELEKRLLKLPPMPGAEYLTVDALLRCWEDLDIWVRDKVDALGQGLRPFLVEELPHWRQVGRVCFHLAENKNDTDYPFAFIATYAASMGENARLKYQPLGKALMHYAHDDDRQKLITLLKPVSEASKKCAWVKRLLDSHDIYHPLAWTADEAYALLSSVPELEESGLIVRLPDWWQKRSKPKVQVTLGSVGKKALGLDEMLSFSVEVVLAGQSLTPAELEHLSTVDAGLISLRGQWVEVDADKLQQALAHWQDVEKNIGRDGMTFVEGMRLLAGTEHTGLSSDASIDDECKNWADVSASDELRALLEQLRHPENIQSKQPGKALKATLRPYQHIGVNWLNFLTELGLGACLADDMGLGKTIQIIALLLMKKSKLPSLIVLPTSLLSNWKAELQRFAPSLKIFFVHSAELDKKQLADSDALRKSFSKHQVVLTTYGMLSRQDCLQAQHWAMIILDEAQAIKNPTAKQTKAVKALKGQSRIALTGTPIENRLGDLWSLFDFLCPGLLGSSGQFKAYLKDMNKAESPDYSPLRKLVQPYILRRLKTDKTIVPDLPDKTETIAWCGLSKKQAVLYKRMVKELERAIETAEGIKRRGLVLSYLMRFKQVCNHPSHVLGDNHYLKKDSGKWQRLMEICEEIAARQEKALIFTQFKELTEPLAEFLASVFNRPGLVLHGGTPVKQRQKRVEQFQEEAGPPFFVLSLKAGGTGLNLTAASHVIHFDRWWNPAVENQATDRAFRIGQKKNVLVHKFVCRGTIEDKIHAMIQEKAQLADNVLTDGADTLLTELSDEKLLSIVSLDLEKSQLV